MKLLFYSERRGENGYWMEFFCSSWAEMWPIANCMRMYSCQLKDAFGVCFLLVIPEPVPKKVILNSVLGCSVGC